MVKLKRIKSLTPQNFSPENCWISIAIFLFLYYGMNLAVLMPFLGYGSALRVDDDARPDLGVVHASFRWTAAYTAGHTVLDVLGVPSHEVYVLKFVD